MCKDIHSVSFWLNVLSFFLSALLFSYLGMHLMGSDLNNIIKQQALTDEHVQFLVYQILRGLKVSSWWQL